MLLRVVAQSLKQVELLSAKQSVFFSKSVNKSVRRGVVSLSVFSLIPDLLFDSSRVFENAKIRTVLQSKLLS